jgi:hypothetical protein
LLIVAAPCALLAATLRPPDAVLCVAVLVVGTWNASRAQANRYVLLGAGLLGLVAVLPVAGWNYWYFDTIWPFGQHETLPGVEGVFIFEPGHIFEGLSGLLISPGRGVLWFAPIFLVGCVWKRRQDAILPAALLAQLVIAAVFWKWWGGLAFGPRLLALPTWVAVFAAVCSMRSHRRWLYPALVVTFLVGVAAAVRYDPRQWEMPNNPDEHQDRLWQITDSPLVALFASDTPNFELRDAPPGPFVYCKATPASQRQRVLSPP